MPPVINYYNEYGVEIMQDHVSVSLAFIHVALLMLYSSYKCIEEL